MANLPRRWTRGEDLQELSVYDLHRVTFVPNPRDIDPNWTGAWEEYKPKPFEDITNQQPRRTPSTVTSRACGKENQPPPRTPQPESRNPAPRSRTVPESTSIIEEATIRTRGPIRSESVTSSLADLLDLYED